MNKRDLTRWDKAFDAIEKGYTAEQVARASGLSPETIYRFLRGDQTSRGLEAAAALGRDLVDGNEVAKPLSPEATRALNDFGYFRLRYFGRYSKPWAVRAANDVLDALATPVKEWVVVNAPPGAGKSTLFTQDIPAWLVARDRTVRILIGSRTARQAELQVSRLRNTFERDLPLQGDPEMVVRGLAADAQATLQDDFGRFQPVGRSQKWRDNALNVRQLNGIAVDDKESTVAAYGYDSGILGGRFDVVMWDDLVDKHNIKTEESREAIREWWSEQAEARVEPGGAMVLQGQRMAWNDLYRFCLGLRNPDNSPKYRHVVYSAHDDEHCRGHDEDEQTTPPPWPDGCLLDPDRLPMRELATTKYNYPRVYEVQYQQRDGDLVGGLIEEEWITGGVDSNGFDAPGCLDKERAMREPPEHLLDGRSWSFVTTDPAAGGWWGVIWWLFDPVTGRRYVMDIIRARLSTQDYLHMDLDDHSFDGILEDIRADSNRLRVPLQYVIFEQNAAQKWFLQQPYVQKWQQVTGIPVVGHTTTINKADPKFGLESIGVLFQHGQIRLPHKNVTDRMKVQDLVTELKVYDPDSKDTTDLLMSTWFHKLAIENHYTGQPTLVQRFPRPGYMENRGRGLDGFGGVRRGMAGAGSTWT